MHIRSRVATLLAAPALLLAACGGDGGDGGTQATAPPQPAAEFYPSIETEEAAPIPTWLHAFGGVGETSPGQTRSVVVDLKAGAYAWFFQHQPGAGRGPAAVQAGRRGVSGGHRRPVGGAAADHPRPDHGRGGQRDRLPVRDQRVQGRHQPDHLHQRRWPAAPCGDRQAGRGGPPSTRPGSSSPLRTSRDRRRSTSTPPRSPPCSTAAARRSIRSS
jgi:hypothetical protein